MSVSLINITWPIMVWPSSSHTAWALKLWQFARAFFGELPDSVIIYLHWSFWTVYKGHATDKAIIWGLLNLWTDDILILDSFNLAKNAWLNFKFVPCSLWVWLHPNTAKIVMKKWKKEYFITWASVWWWAIKITEINWFETNLKEIIGLTSTVIVMHQDAKWVLHTITSALTKSSNNIASVYSVRTSKNWDAMTIIETDEKIDQCELDKIKKLNIYIKSIFELK